ncbi:small ribosomal subunit protein bS18m isoform X2 [Pogona vitticeps]|nr:28S ribosomal protein S18c, mitochondrial [Pogona vitticeps]
MAALVRLVGTAKDSGRSSSVFAGLRKGSWASGLVILQNRKYCLQTEQVPSQADMPVEMEDPYKEPLKKCILCGVTVDYKNIQLLSQFISPYTGRLLGRHITGLCGKKQLAISKAIKRSRCMGLMPVTYKHPTFRSDPKICNIKYPQ